MGIYISLQTLVENCHHSKNLWMFTINHFHLKNPFGNKAHFILALPFNEVVIQNSYLGIATMY